MLKKRALHLRGGVYYRGTRFQSVGKLRKGGSPGQEKRGGPLFGTGKENKPSLALTTLTSVKNAATSKKQKKVKEREGEKVAAYR